MSVAVIIVAAGRGTRIGGEIPKQYVSLGRTTAIRLAIEAFLKVPLVQWVVPVIHPSDSKLFADALDGVRDVRMQAPVEGSVTRALSVRRGLESLEETRPDKVLIHDAARPFTPKRIIEEAISALDFNDGVCAALPVVDALWKADGLLATVAVSRDGLWRAQTPQGFCYKKILSAHKSHDGSGTDDVTVARRFGLNVAFIYGSEQNYKITTKSDLEKARQDIKLLVSDHS